MLICFVELSTELSLSLTQSLTSNSFAGNRALPLALEFAISASVSGSWILQLKERGVRRPRNGRRTSWPKGHERPRWSAPPASHELPRSQSALPLFWRARARARTPRNLAPSLSRSACKLVPYGLLKSSPALYFVPEAARARNQKLGTKDAQQTCAVQSLSLSLSLSLSV